MTSAEQDSWPPEDLEYMNRCPVCASPDRQLALASIEDLTFRTAPGHWTMWRCAGCCCAYLDPRPTPASIGRAYRRYYTHVADYLGRLSDQSVRKRFKRALSNQVLRRLSRNAELTERSLPHLPVSAATKLSNLLHIIRHLPRPSVGDRLLDVGCGDGGFLAIADRLGYPPTGLDFDSVALDAAHSAGFDVRLGSLPGSGLPEASFAHVMFSHVLEHLHDPAGALDEALRLLRPGGRIWISLPNLSSAGLARFQQHWRGLEAPRHLTMWTPAALLKLLRQRGFKGERLVFPDLAATEFYYRQSQAQRRGVDPYQTLGTKLDDPSRREIRELLQVAATDYMRADALTVIAFRPGGL